MKPAPLLLLLGAAQVAAAQGPVAKLEDLRPPSSPAFTLMGVEPKTIERPKTPRAFVLSAVQAVKDANGIPRSYAMEFAPYWLVPHPALEFNPAKAPSVGNTMLQTFSVSIATSSDSGSAHTSIGLGLRTMLVRGNLGDTVKVLVDTMVKLQTAIGNTDDPDVEARISDELKSLSLDLQRQMFSKGFRFEVAAAAMGTWEDGKYKTGELSRLGIWATPSFQLARPKLDITALLRFLFNKGDRSGTNFDYGAKLSYDMDPVTVAWELVARTSIDATVTTSGPGPTTGTFTLDNTYRSAGSVEYKLGAGSSVLFTFGRNFTETPEARNLIATLTVNLGFGNIPVFQHKSTGQ